MTDHKVAQPGFAEPAATAPRAATTEGQQAQEAPRRMTARRPSGASGVAAAFGSG